MAKTTREAQLEALTTDLAEFEDDLSERVGLEGLSPAEATAAKGLIRLCQHIATNYGSLTDA